MVVGVWREGVGRRAEEEGVGWEKRLVCVGWWGELLWFL